MEFILFVPILLFSIIVHEYSHGYVAMKHGDDTARIMGRLTFNPLSHIDLVGTIILPIICIYNGLPVFGWAKPVPVNPFRLRDPEKDMVKVAIAGPLSNIMLAILGVLIFKLFISLGVFKFVSGELVGKLMWYFISLNIILAIFNLIPIPPLDGSKVLMGFLPRNMAIEYEKLSRYGFIILIILLVTGIIRHILLPPFYLAIKMIENFLRM